MTPSVQVRDELVDVLRRDLIGPLDTHEEELLPQPPSRWYLTGFLIPYEAPESQRFDANGQEELDVGGDEGGHAAGDDAAAPEQASARRAFFPSSLGVSVLVPTDAKELAVTVTWGDYRPEAVAADAPADEAPEPKPEGKHEREERWRRVPHAETLRVPVVKRGRQSHEVAGSGGLQVVVSVRPVRTPADEPKTLVPKGTRAVSVFLVNHRVPREDQRRDEGFVFQARLVVQSERAFVARPDLRGRQADDPDEQVAELQHRDVFEYAVGHGVSTRALCDDPGDCRAVETTWVPSAEVEKVVPGAIAGGSVQLGMESLAALTDAPAVRAAVGGLVDAYGAWITAQRAAVTSPPWRATVATTLLDSAEGVRQRVAAGLALLDDPEVLRAFRVMNKVMARSARQRTPERYTAKGSEPSWFPFQLAFVLMNLRGVTEPSHPERRMVDLLFFPTGGGKTEAYLGLAAFTLLLRRRRHPGVSSAGVSVLMRYTLRLLTLDQLGRAATLICALELERRDDPATWGTWPFEIGLWVGKGATPNDMGEKGDGRDDTARAKAIAYKNDTKKPTPIPLEVCPWCATPFTAASFRLAPQEDKPTQLVVACVSRKRGPDRCPFTGNDALPVVAVDQPLYRRLPCFVIATVDKFANLPWVGRTGALFGRVDRHDKDGFYGPCDPHHGDPLDGPLPPPDLIIQDELHLISGPLGTMVGLYETALDWLCTRGVGESAVGPKIVASTATVRRAQQQIQGLFARSRVEVFPPPGPDRRDSFFAKTVPPTERNARRYVGVAAQGRSLKVVLLRVYIALLAAAQRRYDALGGAKTVPNPADPYMSLLGYFNSLRELGGSRRIVEDEVTSRLRVYDRRRRVGEAPGAFAARSIGEVVELTSRETTAKVSLAKHRLAHDFTTPERVDVALATNMISVGLDITRLGLMVVLGQPKMAAEYIQATSRVGRDDGRPGLVVTLLNIHRPRDRSHYERFEAWHASFYRAVEATSVTPFSPRAVDRGLAAVVVALARHGRAELTPPLGAGEMRSQRAAADFVLDVVGDRAASHASGSAAEGTALRAKLRGRAKDLLDAWAKLAALNHDAGAPMEYQREVKGKATARLLRDPLDPDLPQCSTEEKKFRARRSLRDVEPQVKLWVKRLDGVEMDAEEEGR
jgi:hypothetical protein